jgi:hypothetical protein
MDMSLERERTFWQYFLDKCDLEKACSGAKVPLELGTLLLKQFDTVDKRQERHTIVLSRLVAKLASHRAYQLAKYHMTLGKNSVIGSYEELERKSRILKNLAVIVVMNKNNVDAIEQKIDNEEFKKDIDKMMNTFEKGEGKEALVN